MQVWCMVHQHGVQQVNNYLSSRFCEVVRFYFVLVDGILIEIYCENDQLCRRHERMRAG